MSRRPFEVRLTTTVEASSPHEATFRALQLIHSGSVNRFHAFTAEGAQNAKPVTGLKAWILARRGEWLDVLHFGSPSELSSSGIAPCTPMEEAVAWIGSTYSTDDLPQETPDVQNAT